VVKVLIKKILVPIDGSKSADRALDFALDLARKYSAEVVVISVFDAPSVSLVAPGIIFAPESIANYLKELKAFLEKVLSEALKKAKKLNVGLKVSKELLQGRAANIIVETAQKGAFDIIVIGSRGLGGIKEFVLGSTSHRVADEAPCPVLIIKESTSS
jgi:nucleotide-binding universal stress UspA family protein